VLLFPLRKIHIREAQCGGESEPHPAQSAIASKKIRNRYLSQPIFTMKNIVMNANKFVFLSAIILLTSPLLAADQLLDESKPPPEFFKPPAGIDIMALPEPILENPPVYLDVDSNGNVYRLNAVKNKSGTYTFSHVLMNESNVDDIRSQRDVVLQNMEDLVLPGQQQSAASSSACPVPGNYSIVGDSNGNAVGFMKVANTNRPPNVTTQWMVFDFYTENYRDRGSHMPIALFHEDTMHGWGTFIGDNHLSAAGCGASARFNSQIEAWIQYGTPPQPPSATWQASVFNGPTSCGNEMYDGPGLALPGGIRYPRYRMEMHSSTGHWAAYRIWEFQVSSWSWVVLTSWKSLDVDTGYWPFPPPVFNNAAEGIFIFATNAATSGTWKISITSTQCGWF